MKLSAMARMGNLAGWKKPLTFPAQTRTDSIGGQGGFTLLEALISLAVLTLLASASFQTMQSVLSADAAAQEMEQQSLGVQGAAAAQVMDEPYTDPKLILLYSESDDEAWQLLEISTRDVDRMAVDVALPVRDE